MERIKRYFKRVVKARRGWGGSNIKKVGVLVVSLRGVNFRFWSRLGCCEEITNIFSLQGLA